MDDATLLQEYACDGSEGAFRTLLERHLPLVYSAALRQVGNAALAQDVTQVVFTLLARKAVELSGKTVLTGWLYQTTRHTAAKTLRRECRRHHREQEALIMQSAQTGSEWQHWAPFLDEAMAQLAKRDRDAVLLRYFRNKSLREVGHALGMNEDTAQKRVSRAIEKLRRLLLKRGVAISAVALTGLLATHAAQFAPEGLAASIAAAALSKAAGSAPALALLQEVLRQPVWPKAAISATAALALAGLTGAALRVWPIQTPQPASYSFQSKIVVHQRVVQAVVASSTIAPQPAPPSDGITPALSANTAPQPRTGGPAVQLMPSQPLGPSNALARASAVSANPPLPAGWPRTAYLSSVTPPVADTAANGQQVPEAADGGASLPGAYPPSFAGQSAYPVAYGVMRRGFQAPQVQAAFTTMRAQTSVQPWMSAPSAPLAAPSVRATAARKTPGPRH